MAPILKVRNLVTRFHTIGGTIHAVNGVSFDLEEGETLAIVGESGCGKTVTILSLMRLIPEPPGKIEGGQALFYAGAVVRDLLDLPEPEIRQIRGGQIGVVFQDPMTSLHPVLPIGLQISESLVEHCALSMQEARERTIELLRQVGLPDPESRYSNYPHQFSGGMRQRVMIAMAIACRPSILIADEPTTALDVTIQAQIIDLVKRLRDELHMAVVWITHDLGVIAGLANQVMVMYGGLFLEKARVGDLYKRPQHPYTIGLLGAVPRLDKVEIDRLVSIKGAPPELVTEPTCCPFAPRCPYVMDRCLKEVPPLYKVDVQHHSACFYDLERGMPREC